MTLPNNITFSNEECLDNSENVMAETGILLPDGRMLFELNQELWCLCSDGHFEPYNPVMILPWEEKISRIRKIVEDRAYAMIEGQLVDLFSASAIVAVYDNLSLQNQLRFLSRSVSRMAEMAFRLLK